MTAVTTSAPTTGADLLVTSLAGYGIDTAFGVPGLDSLPVHEALAGHGVREVTTRHEQGAGYAADGYARVLGRPAVVLTCGGPGLLNAAAAIAQAHSDSVPMVVVSPGPPTTERPGSGRLHELRDSAGVLAGICAHTERVTAVGHLPAVVADAMDAAVSGRPGPAHVEVPVNLLTEAGTPGRPARPGLPASRPVPTAGEISAAASALAGARRPVLVAGGGARSATGPLRTLAERLGAAVLTTANGKGVLDERHPLALGVALHLPTGRALLADADVVVAVGTELAGADSWDGLPQLTGVVVRIDTDRGRLHRNAVAAHPLVGDAAEVIELLGRALDGLPRPTGTDARRGRVGSHRTAVRRDARSSGRPWRELLCALRAVLPEQTVLVGDNAMACYHGALTGFELTPAGRYLHPTGLGTLGYALPAALGAAAAAPGRPVAVLTGDGGLQFSVPELATAVDLGAPLPIVVSDNGGYGVIRTARRDGAEARWSGPDLVGLARAYGAHGVHAHSPAEAAAHVRAALTRAGPTVVTVAEPS